MPGDNFRHAAGASFCPDDLHSPLPHTNHGAGSKVNSSPPAGIWVQHSWCEGKSYPQFCESYPQLFYISSCN